MSSRLFLVNWFSTRTLRTGIFNARSRRPNPSYRKECHVSNLEVSAEVVLIQKFRVGASRIQRSHLHNDPVGLDSCEHLFCLVNCLKRTRKNAKTSLITWFQCTISLANVSYHEKKKKWVLCSCRMFFCRSKSSETHVRLFLNSGRHTHVPETDLQIRMTQEYISNFQPTIARVAKSRIHPLAVFLRSPL